jgi:crossover junction endodeoxyribonuclease RuvC
VRILGIDPGLATIGLSTIDADSPTNITVVEWLTIETAAGTSLPERLLDIQTDLTEYIATARPDLAVVERLFFARNESSAFEVAHARGAILLTLAEHGIPVLEPTPLQLKACITGDGKADKQQVQAMLQRMLSLTTLPRPDDAADALALAVYGAITQMHPLARE